MIAKAVHDSDTFSKVWGVIGPFVAAVLAALLTVCAQIYIAHKQREHESTSSQEEADETAQLSGDKLSMWNIASQRKANARVAQMRQVWINELRQDAAEYLSLWQDIAFRWASMVSNPDKNLFESQTLEALNAPIAKMRQDAHELRLRIAMRLNPGEGPHQELVRLMMSLEGEVGLLRRDRSTKPAGLLLAEIDVSIKNVVSKMQEILKVEWNVVKSELGVHSVQKRNPSA